MKSAPLLFVLLVFGVAVAACDHSARSDERNQSVGYRSGTSDDGYTSNGERGNVLITEINWVGSVRELANGESVYDPDDVFIELQNKHARPIHLTGWQLIVESGTSRPGASDQWARHERPRRTWSIPARAGGQPIPTNEYVVIVKKADGAVIDPDFVIPDLEIPDDHFSIELRDIDDRLIEPAGDEGELPFAGSWDLVTIRSMERVQLLFGNRGSREISWHTYSYNVWDERHAELQEFLKPEYRTFTYASPRRANSPDYSGNTSSGNFE